MSYAIKIYCFFFAFLNTTTLGSQRLQRKRIRKHNPSPLPIKYVLGQQGENGITYWVTPILSGLLINNEVLNIDSQLTEPTSFDSISAVKQAYKGFDLKYMPLSAVNVTQGFVRIDINGRRLEDPPGGWGDIAASSGNCYRYSCKDPTPTPGHPDHYRCPGGIDGRNILGLPLKDACFFIMAGARNDGLIDPPCNSKTHYEVCIYAGARPAGQFRDYHVYRCDPGGKWSHKRGSLPVEDRDRTGKPITHPDTCNRDYSPSGGINYTEKCGCLCVPNGGIDVDKTPAPTPAPIPSPSPAPIPNPTQLSQMPFQDPIDKVGYHFKEDMGN